MSVGENVANLRKRKNLSQEELAAMVNVSRPMISQIERGTKMLSITLGQEIAKVLDCKLDDFIKDKSV